MDTVDRVITSEDTPPEDILVQHAWRDDNWLVLHEKKAVIPRRCVICDSRVNAKPIKVSLRDTPSHTDSFGLLAFGLLAVVLTSSLTPRATLQLWFCAEHSAKKQPCSYRTLLIFSLLGIALLVTGFIAILIWSNPNVPDSTWTIVVTIGIIMMSLGSIPLIVFLLILASPPRLIRVKKIDKPFVWLEDVSPEYLARFPEVPRQ